MTMANFERRLRRLEDEHPKATSGRLVFQQPGETIEAAKARMGISPSVVCLVIDCGRKESREH